MTFQKVEPFSVTTNNTIRQDSPDKKINNPLKKDIFVNGIELLLSPEFAKKGKLLILVNDVSVLESQSGELVGYSKYPIPIGKVLKRSNNIQIFAWNGTDSNSIKATGNIFLAENQQPFNSQAETSSQADSNREFSPSEIIFPEQKRAPASFTKIIDLQGHKAMIVSVSKTISPSRPTFLRNDGNWQGQSGNQVAAVDGNLSTKGPNYQLNSGNTASNVWDFLSIASRKATMKIDSIINANGCNFEIFTSDDDISYTSRKTGTISGLGAKTFGMDSAVSFRYVRFEFDQVAAGNFNFQIFEVYDIIGQFGSANLTFEVRNPATNLWISYKTVVTGFTDLSSALTSLIEGNLPSTQTDFRINYSISSAPLNNSISIIKVTE